MISEEVCVLSAAGTAAIVKLQPSEMDSSMISNKDIDFKRDNLKSDVNFAWITHQGFKNYLKLCLYSILKWFKNEWLHTQIRWKFEPNDYFQYVFMILRIYYW